MILLRLNHDLLFDLLDFFWGGYVPPIIIYSYGFVIWISASRAAVVTLTVVLGDVQT